jgi:hypothetical protein
MQARVPFSGSTRPPRGLRSNPVTLRDHGGGGFICISTPYSIHTLHYCTKYPCTLRNPLSTRVVYSILRTHCTLLGLPLPADNPSHEQTLKIKSNQINENENEDGIMVRHRIPVLRTQYLASNCPVSRPELN